MLIREFKPREFGYSSLQAKGRDSVTKIAECQESPGESRTQSITELDGKKEGATRVLNVKRIGPLMSHPKFKGKNTTDILTS